MSKTIHILFALLLFAIGSVSGHAQGYPVKPVVFIVPFAVSSENDTLLRAVTQRFTEGWGRPALLESRPGANGIIGNEYVTKAAPDGYTLLFSSSSLLMLSLYTKLPYDPSRDLVPMAGLIKTAFALAAKSALPVNNLRDLIEYAKARPGQVSYATYGIGSNIHLAMEMLQTGAGVKLNHITYKGALQATTDAVAGHVDMVINNINATVPYIKSGKLRGLGVTSTRRSNLLPDVSTFAEAGLPGFEVTGWWGIHGPTGVPRNVIERVNADTRKVLSDPAFRAKYMDPLGYEPLITSNDEFGSFVRADFAKLSKVVRDNNIKLD